VWVRPPPAAGPALGLSALVLAAALAGPPAAAAAQEAALHVIKRGTFSEDLYLAGDRVEFSGDAHGDLFVAGRAVSVEGRVRSDLMIAGATIVVKGRVQDDMRVAGRVLLLDDVRVTDTLIAAAEVLRVSAGSEVGGPAWLLGRRIDIAGSLRRELRAAAARVRISGTVDGDVVLAARDIEILPTARVRGSLVYWSGQEARIEPGAQIRGPIVHRQPEFLDRAGRILTVVATITRALFVVNLLAAGLILFLLFPGFTVSAARTIQREPGASLALGIVLVAGIPVVLGCLVLSIVGAPLGLALVPVYLVALLIGLLTAAFCLGELGAHAVLRRPELSRGAHVAGLLVALTALSLVRLIPIAGNVILLLAVVVGLGGWTLRVYRRYRGEDPEGGLPSWL
jgi:cytoskeletal protein CcmA (bactofilin family)